MAVEFDSYAALYNDANLTQYFKLENTTATVGTNLTNVNTVTFVSGLYNNAAHFVKASNQYLYNTASVASGSLTIMCWVKINTAVSANECIIAAGDATKKLGYWLEYQYNGGTKRLWFDRNRDNVADNEIAYNVDLGTGAWKHVALTYNGTTMYGYLNGANIGNVGASGDGGGTTARVTGCFAGSRDYTGGILNPINADVDDFVVFSRALTDQEITDYYNATAVSGPANLKSYNTNLKANIKTVNTNAIANMKSLNTNV